MTIGADAPSVQTYVGILQATIGRLSANSANCKTWCTTLVAAILVLVVEHEEGALYANIAFGPVIFFCFLDSYYLALERLFRELYSEFVEKLSAGAVEAGDLFRLQPFRGKAATFGATLAALGSFSTSPFYLVLAALVATLKRFAL